MLHTNSTYTLIKVLHLLFMFHCSNSSLNLLVSPPTGSGESDVPPLSEIAEEQIIYWGNTWTPSDKVAIWNTLSFGGDTARMRDRGLPRWLIITSIKPPSHHYFSVWCCCFITHQLTWLPTCCTYLFDNPMFLQSSAQLYESSIDLQNKDIVTAQLSQLQSLNCFILSVVIASPLLKPLNKALCCGYLLVLSSSVCWQHLVWSTTSGG